MNNSASEEFGWKKLRIASFLFATLAAALMIALQVRGYDDPSCSFQLSNRFHGTSIVDRFEGPMMCILFSASQLALLLFPAFFIRNAVNPNNNFNGDTSLIDKLSNAVYMICAAETIIIIFSLIKFLLIAKSCGV